MKFVLGAIVLSLFCLQILALDNEDQKNAKEKCLKQLKLTEKDVKTDKGNLKKFIKCLFEELGVLEGNTINEEKLKNFIEVKLPQLKDQAQEIAQECSKRNEKEPEEIAFAAVSCISDKKNKV